MKLSVAGHKMNRGFALPTVLIASVVLLTILAVSVTATTSARTTLKNQYYAQLAQIAGEAGVAYAQACLQESGNIPTWTDAKPLTPSTDCNGDPRTAPATVEALVVAGGGGGGGNCDTCGGAGGGGGGGRLYDPSFSVGVGSISVTVGNGGAGGVELPSRTNGSNGSNSVFGSMTAIGGGGGGAQLGTAGLNGGSVGGGSGGSSPAPGAGGNFTAGQGNVGGAGSSSSTVGGGGGGGAGGVGQPGTGSQDGGLGFAYSITGTSLFYAGGGGGGETSTAAPGAGGSGVGGAGANQSTNAGNGFNGAANSGGGGGGAAGQPTGGNGGNGGSGVVIVRYPTGSVTATGGTITTNAGFTIHRFTSNGTFNITAVQPLFTCPADDRCHVSVDGNVRSSFSVGRPTLDSDGRAVTIPQNGYVELVRESTGAVWRTYRQPTTQPTVAPGLCSGAATTGLGWTSAVLTTASGSFPEPRAQTIGIAAGNVNPGTLFYRKDFSISEADTYTMRVKGDSRAIVYVDGKLTTRTATNLVTNTVDIELSAGCHTVAIVAPHTGVTASTASIQFALTKRGASIPVLVSDRTWRVAAGDTVPWTNVNYAQDNTVGWAPVRDLGGYTVAPWTGGPTSWLTITNDASARWINTNHSFSSTNYPAASYAYFRSNNFAAWNLASATEIQFAAACDDDCSVFLNGQEITRTSTWSNVGTATVVVPAGQNQVSVRLLNTNTVANPSGLLFSARRTSDSVVIDRSTTAWAAASSWTSTIQSYGGYNVTYRPSPEVFTCNCTTQGTTNFASNPSFETNTDTVTGINTTVSRSSSQAFSGTFSARGSVINGAQNAGLAIRVDNIEPGVVYRVSGYFYAPAAVRIGYSFFDRNGGALVTSVNASNSTVNAWTRLNRLTVAVPPGTEYMEIRFTYTADQPAGTNMFVDGILVSQGSTIHTYADGGSPGWSWVETPNASPSSGPLL